MRQSSFFEEFENLPDFAESKHGSRSGLSIQEAFEDFHRCNPWVYDRIVAAARRMKGKGFKHYSIKTIWETLRWHWNIERDAQETYKLNNNYYSRYARLIMEKEADLAGFFNTRKLIS